MQTEWKFYIFDMFREGYKIDNTTEVPQSLFNYVYIFESIMTLLPSVKFSFTDAAGAISDLRKEGQLVIFTGDNDVNSRWFDFAILSQKSEGNTQIVRPSSLSKVYYGIDIIGMWLLQSRSRSFGYCSIGDVVKKIYRDAVERYSKYVRIKATCKISGKDIKGTFIQVDNSIKFLQYLKEVAGASNNTGYFAWLDREKDGVAVRFRSINELKAQDVGKYFELEYSPEELEKAFLSGNDGMIRENVLPVVQYSVDSRNVGVYANNQIWKLVKFDIKNNRVAKKFINLITDEKDITKSFFEKEWSGEFGRIVSAVNDFEGLLRRLARLQEARLKRKVWIWTTGCSKLRVGEKVRLLVPSGYGSDMYETLSGDWIVGSIVHCLSNPDFRWFMKVGLMSEEFNKVEPEKQRQEVVEERKIMKEEDQLQRKTFDKLSDITTAIVDKISDVANKVKSEIVGNLSTVMEDVIGQMGNEMLPLMEEMQNRLGAGMANMMSDEILDTLSQSAGQLMDKLPGLTDNITSKFSEITDVLSNNLGSVTEQVISGIGSNGGFQDIMNRIQEQDLSKIFNDTVDKFRDINSILSEKMPEFGSGIQEMLGNVGNKMKDVLSGIGGESGEVLNNLADKITENFGGINEGVMEKLSNIQEQMTDMVSGLGGVLQDKFSDMKDVMQDVFEQMNTGKDGLSKIIDRLNDEEIQEKLEGITEEATAVFEEKIGELKGKIEGLKEQLIGIGEKVKKTIEEGTGGVFGAGEENLME